MISSKLYKEENMEIIRVYADLALKEYNFVRALDILDKEIRSSKFTLVKYKNANIKQETFILIGLEDL